MIRALLLALLMGAFSLVASAQQHSVTCTWQWSQGTGDPATGFHLQRSATSGGPYTTVGTVPNPTTMTYTDTAVAAGQTYYYVVTAFNTAGDSAPSNEVKAIIPFQAPQIPTTLSITAK